MKVIYQLLLEIFEKGSFISTQIISRIQSKPVAVGGCLQNSI